MRLTSADDCEQNVVVEVLANSRKINNDRNIDTLQQDGITNSRDLEDLRSVN